MLILLITQRSKIKTYGYIYNYAYIYSVCTNNIIIQIYK